MSASTQLSSEDLTLNPVEFKWNKQTGLAVDDAQVLAGELREVPEFTEVLDCVEPTGSPKRV